MMQDTGKIYISIDFRVKRYNVEEFVVITAMLDTPDEIRRVKSRRS